MNQSIFEKRIKPVLLYVGTIGAIAMSIGYIILMFVLILGFKANTSLGQSITFAVINAIAGFIIMQFLKIQGIDFAKDIEKNQTILHKYQTNVLKQTPKNKKKHYTLKYFWVRTLITDIASKLLSTIIITSCIIYIVIEGSNDYTMLLLSIVNLILFACLGLLSLVSAYEFYNNQYVPYMEECLQLQAEETASNITGETQETTDLSQGDIQTDVYITKHEHE